MILPGRTNSREEGVEEGRLTRWEGRELEQTNENYSSTKRKNLLTSPLYFLSLRTDRNKRLLGMVDSGAEMNVIGGKLAEYLDSKVYERPPIKVKGSGGTTYIHQFIDLQIYLTNGHCIKITAGISPTFGTALILGAPFLHSSGGNLDFKNHSFMTKFGMVPCIFCPNLEESNTLEVATVNVQSVVNIQGTKAEMGDEDLRTLERIMGQAKLEPQEKKELKDVLIEYGDLWMGNPQGRTSIIKHRIKVTTNKPIRQKPRRFAAEQNKIIDDHIKEMLAQNIIRPSSSPHAQEIVLVKKKDGEWRFCIDYRRLNDVTVADEFPLPRINELIRHIKDSRYFVTLDLRAGYWQIMMDHESIPLTAFRAHQALYEYLVMPFGLKTAPATFSRLMNEVVGDLYWQGVCIYLDDILVHNVEFKEALRLTKIVLERLRRAGLTLSIKKCEFFPKELLYLGYIIGEGYMRPNQ